MVKNNCTDWKSFASEIESRFPKNFRIIIVCSTATNLSYVFHGDSTGFLGSVEMNEEGQFARDTLKLVKGWRDSLR